MRRQLAVKNILISVSFNPEGRTSDIGIAHAPCLCQNFPQERGQIKFFYGARHWLP